MKFSVYGNKYEQNQTDMLGTICSSVIAKHPDKLKEAADAAGAVLAKDELRSSEENVYLKTKVEEYTKECLENINL